MLNNTSFPHLIYVTWTNLLPIKEVMQSLMGNINSLNLFFYVFNDLLKAGNDNNIKLDSLLR